MITPPPSRILHSLLLMGGLAALPLHAQNWEGAHVEESVLDATVNPASAMVAFAASATRHGCRIAKVEGSALDGFTVRIDGKAGPRYSEIALATPLFSENGASVAYAARRGIAWRWVINGVEEPAFPELTPTSFAFSADGKHHAYIASPKFRHTVLVADGVAYSVDPGSKVQPWDAAPVYSADGGQLAWAEAMREPQQMRVNIAGKPGPWMEGIGMTGSSGFGAQPASDGMAGPAAQPGVFVMGFSPDGKHFAYSVKTGERWCKVIDGVKSPPHDGIGGDFVFSPDGKDHAYLVHDGPSHFLLRGVDPPLKVEELNNWTLTFSPDSKHLAFAGVRDGVSAVWLDGNAVPSDLPVVKTKNQGSLFFSPDSKRLAYGIEDNQPKLRWVIDGRAGPGTTVGLGQFSFSADSAHFAYVLPRPQSKDVAIIFDGTVRASYDVVACGPVFLPDGTLEFLALKDGALFRFKVTGY